MAKPERLNMNYIKKLGSEFLNLETIQERKSEILAEVKAILSSLPIETSYGKTLEFIGVNYFGAVNSSQKTEKGRRKNYDTYILYLSPSDISGIQFCKFASEGCRAACLNLSGRALMAERSQGRVNNISLSRLVKSWLVAFNRELAEKIISHEISRESKKAKAKGHKFSARLNGTSDLFFGKVIRSFPDVQFYDYTKNASFLKLSENFENWHVTFSFSGTNLGNVRRAIQGGFHVAFPVVNKKDVERLIKAKKGYSMDETDLRFLDKLGNQFGLLTVKETPGTKEGIDKGFLLSQDMFLAIRRRIELDKAVNEIRRDIILGNPWDIYDSVSDNGYETEAFRHSAEVSVEAMKCEARKILVGIKQEKAALKEGVMA